MSLKSHTLHHISIITVLSCIWMCANWLCAIRIGLGWAHDVFFILHVTCSCIPMHMYSLFNIFWYIWTAWDFSDCPSLSLSFLFTLVMSTARKCKADSSRNPLHFGSSTLSNPTPSSFRFRDEDAWRDFSENFSRQGVLLECRVILVNFANTGLPNVIRSRGWESLFDIPVTCPSVPIQ